MKVAGVFQDVTQALLKSEQRISFPAEFVLGKTFRLGQVIEGRVLRHHEGSRYSMDVSGRERIVDSSVPLKPGEEIRGRIVGIDDRVHVRLLNDNRSQPQAKIFTGEEGGRETARLTHPVDKLFANYNATLNGLERDNVLKLINTVPMPQLVAISALILKKHNIPMDLELLKSLSRALDKWNGSQPGNIEALARLEASIAGGEANTNKKTTEALVQVFKSGLWDTEEVKRKSGVHEVPLNEDPEESADERKISGAGAGNSSGLDENMRREENLGQLLLNVQSDSSVSHRYVNFPLVLGGQLVEIQIVFFSQRHSSMGKEGTQYQKLVLSLETEQLGRTKIIANIADRHLRLSIMAESGDSVSALSGYLPALKQELVERGWIIDEIEYLVQPLDKFGVVNPVVEHYISQDSLSRLM